MQRRRSRIPVVSLVGYTNAGKSTLLNRLSGSDVLVADQLFATLDPTTRRVDLPGGRGVLFTDTVGFIQKLPHTLVAAFRATLEEISESSLLLHVVDASHPNALEQMEAVTRTLVSDLGIEGVPSLVVLNKMDRVGEDDADRLAVAAGHPQACRVSALRGEGLEVLLKQIETNLDTGLAHLVVRIPHTEGTLISHFYDVATVESETYESDWVELTGTLDARYAGEYAPYQVKKKPRRKSE